MMKRLLFVILLCTPFYLFAQNIKIDSLKNALNNADSELAKAGILISLAEKYNQINIGDAIQYINKSLELLEKCKKDSVYYSLMAGAYNTLGIAFNNRGDYTEAIQNFEKAINFDKTGNNFRRATEKTLNLGIIYKSLGNYLKALELYDSTLKTAIKNDYKELYSMTKANMGVLNYEIGDYDNAIEDYYEALKIRREENDLKTVAILLYNIGLIFDDKNDPLNANKHFLEALELFKIDSNLYGEAYCLNCIGSNYVKEENYMEGINYYNKAYAIHEKLDNKQGMAESFGEIGTVYSYNQKYAKAKEFFNLALGIYKSIGYQRGEITILLKLGEVSLEMEEKEKALELFKRGEFLADSIKDKPQMKDAYYYLAETYYNLADYKKAYLNHKMYSQLNDTIFNKEVDENITKLKAKHDISIRENEIKILKGEKILKDLKIRKQRVFSTSVMSVFILVCLFLIALFSQNKKIRGANKLLAYQKKQITDSIEYASRIQTAILPTNEYVSKLIPNHFILYKPRDIVSGDFYWITQKEGKIVLAIVDCTGHGVPGAFMSMLGFAFLNEIVNKENNLKANLILNQLREYVKRSLHQTGKDDEAKDGMDIALCIIDTEGERLQFSGAYNSLHLIRNEEFKTFKADRMPIGIHPVEKESFTNYEISLSKGDMIYLFTDGYVDQFGGEKYLKYKLAPFKELLYSVKDMPVEKQKAVLEDKFEKWKYTYDQIDDVLVMGIKI